MSKQTSSKNPLKDLVVLILIIAFIVAMLKKIKRWLSKLDNDGFKWEQQFSGDVAELVKKYAPAHQHTNFRSKQDVRESNPETAIATPVFGLNSRQEGIYTLVKTRGQVNMNDIVAKVGKKISTRTLRRDMSKLERLGLIARLGKTKDSIYTVKK